MSRIIRMDRNRRSGSPPEGSRCDHKYVTVYASTRKVCCTICGERLDPFDVLLDMTKGHVPTVPHRDEERALALEIVKRKNKSRKNQKKKE